MLDTVTKDPARCTNIMPRLPDDALASVTFNPPAIAPSCAPLKQFDPPPISGRFARACPWTGYDAEYNWLVCIAPEQDGECRPGFSARFEFAERISDDRLCTACDCEAPVGGSCKADVLLFRDAGCTDLMISINGIPQEDTLCADTPADSPLAAARVILAEDAPGTCSPTSSLSTIMGKITRGATRKFCCSQLRLVEGR
ncbi:hypothetical protein ACMHYB_39835 [Sorangium sp. So ce1128]